MYECVLGIPKSEGMQAPPKIPANPSFVELDEDENAVEKFKTAMGNISSILALDKLKQVGVDVYCLLMACLWLFVCLHVCLFVVLSVGSCPEGEASQQWENTQETIQCSDSLSPPCCKYSTFRN